MSKRVHKVRFNSAMHTSLVEECLQDDKHKRVESSVATAYQIPLYENSSSQD